MKLIIEIKNSIYDICKSVRNLPLDENDIMSSLIMQSIANGTPLTESTDCVDRDELIHEITTQGDEKALEIAKTLPSVVPKGAR